MRRCSWFRTLGLLPTLTWSTINIHAQAPPKTYQHVIPSKSYGTEQTLNVFLPESYTADSTQRFVTAYVLDGQFEPYFSMVSSIMSYYEQTNEGIPMVVVGIHTTNRWDEFIPTGNGIDTTQGADRLSHFLRSEVIPLIEANYRVKPFRVGVGHSLGGTYVIHEMTKDNSLFQAGITASPNLTIDDERIVRNAKDYYTRAPKNRRFLHVNAGTVGEMENDFGRSVQRLDSITRATELPNMYWKCTIGEAWGT